MNEDTQKRLAWMPTKELNEHRRVIATMIADLKAAQHNYNLIVNQNTLDKTPYLLADQDTSAQERMRAAQMAMEAVKRVQEVIDTLPQ
jgi:hypothetical protein